MPRNYNKQAQLQDPNNFISANMRLFSIQKNQDNASDHIEATSTSIKPNKSQYTVNTGDIIPKLDDIVVQCESFMLEVDEIMFDWSNSHAIEYHRTAEDFVPPVFDKVLEQEGPFVPGPPPKEKRMRKPTKLKKSKLDKLNLEDIPPADLDPFPLQDWIDAGHPKPADIDPRDEAGGETEQDYHAR